MQSFIFQSLVPPIIEGIIISQPITLMNDSKAVPLGAIHLAFGLEAMSLRLFTGKKFSVDDIKAVKPPV